MIPPVEKLEGEVVDIDSNGVLTIRAKFYDSEVFKKRNYKNCMVVLLDSRPLSDKQRRACYALLREISDFTGQGIDSTKAELKQRFMYEELNLPGMTFSFKNAPMSLVRSFQNYLVDFVLDWDVPCKYPLIDLVTDMSDYLYGCLKHKKCCICGAKSDLHHLQAVGAGRDRNKIVHEGMKVLPLCRRHHTEAHQIGKWTFLKKYHISIDGIKLDKELCELYNLNTKMED